MNQSPNEQSEADRNNRYYDISKFVEPVAGFTPGVGTKKNVMTNAGPKKVQTKMSFTCSSIFSISLRRLSPGDRKSLSAIGECPCWIERIPLHSQTTPIKVSAGIKSDARRIKCGVVRITTFCRLHPSQMASFRNAPPTWIDVAKRFCQRGCFNLSKRSRRYRSTNPLVRLTIL